MGAQRVLSALGFRSCSQSWAGRPTAAASSTRGNHSRPRPTEAPRGSGREQWGGCHRASRSASWTGGPSSPALCGPGTQSPPWVGLFVSSGRPPPWLPEKGPPPWAAGKGQAHGVLLPSHPLKETSGHPSPREGERQQTPQSEAVSAQTWGSTADRRSPRVTSGSFTVREASCCPLRATKV